MKKISLTLLIFMMSISLYAGESNWLRFERGKSYFNKADYGQALSLFRNCISSDSITPESVPQRLYVTDYNMILDKLTYDSDISFFKKCYLQKDSSDYFYLAKDADLIELSNTFIDLDVDNILPEAYFYMAKIYKLEGEYDLAERNYNTALDQVKSLQIEDTMYDIYYDLIELYTVWGKSKQFLQTSAILLEFDKTYTEKSLIRSRKNMYKTFLNQSLFKAVQLYRLEDDKFMEIYSLLGDYYLETGDCEKAFEYSFNSVATVLSVLAQEMFEYDYEYNFDSIESLIEDSLELRYLNDFIVDNYLFKNLYVLGCSLEEKGEIDRSKEIFWLCIRFQESSSWGDKAHKRLLTGIN